MPFPCPDRQTWRRTWCPWGDCSLWVYTAPSRCFSRYWLHPWWWQRPPAHWIRTTQCSGSGYQEACKRTVYVNMSNLPKSSNSCNMYLRRKKIALKTVCDWSTNFVLLTLGLCPGQVTGYGPHNPLPLDSHCNSPTGPAESPGDRSHGQRKTEWPWPPYHTAQRSRPPH